MAAVSTPAMERAWPLLRPEVRGHRVHCPEGYLDLLGHEPESTGPVNDLMSSRFLPLIYERWWRPAVGRLVKGPGGPGMADEYRIAQLVLNLCEGDGVLDVACGPGNFTRRFAETVGPEGLAVGIDAATSMLRRAVPAIQAATYANLAFVRADACNPPFREKSFDAVCCFGALHLLPDPMRALDEMITVLTPGGRIALLTTVRGKTRPLRALESMFEDRSGIRMFEEDGIRSVLRDRGFEDIYQKTSGFVQIVAGRNPAV